MAVIDTAQSGDKDLTSTWVGGIVPVAPDSARIMSGHQLDVSTDWDVGASDGGTTIAIEVEDGATLALASNIQLTYRGPIRLLGATTTWTIPDGCRMHHDTTNDAAPTTARYPILGGTSALHNTIVRCNGLTSNRIIFSWEPGGNSGSIERGGDTARITVQAFFTNFDMGDATNRAFYLRSSTFTNDFILEDCLFSNCGQIEHSTNIPASAVTRILRTTWENSQDALYNMLLKFNSAVLTGERRFEDCVFDKTLWLITPQDVTLKNNFHEKRWLITGAEPYTSENCFVYSDEASVNIRGNNWNRFYFYGDDSGSSNYHVLNPGADSGTVMIQRAVFEARNSNREGECIFLPTDDVPMLVQNCVVPKNKTTLEPLGKLVAQTNVGTQGPGNNTIIHNTAYRVLITSGETAEPINGQWGAIKSNICWDDLAATRHFFQSLGGVNPPGSPPDTAPVLDGGDVDYNAFKNTSSGDVYPGPITKVGFDNLRVETNPANVNANGWDNIADFEFRDEDRDIAAWDADLGGPGTVESAMDRLKADTSLIAVLIDWVIAGVDTSNATLEDAGHDGQTVGAGAFWSPAVNHFVTVKSGNLLFGDTWDQGTVPGPGDTIHINHNCSLDGTLTIGTQPTDDTTVVATIDAGVFLWLAGTQSQPAILNCRGSFLISGGPDENTYSSLRLYAWSQLVFDNSAVSVKYSLQMGQSDNYARLIMRGNDTESSAIITSNGMPWRLLSEQLTELEVGMGEIDLSFGRIENLVGESNHGWIFFPRAIPGQEVPFVMSMRDGVIDNSGSVYNLGNLGIEDQIVILMDRMTVINPVNRSVEITIGPMDKGAGAIRQISNCAFNGDFWLTNPHQVDIRRNVYADQALVSGTVHSMEMVECVFFISVAMQWEGQNLTRCLFVAEDGYASHMLSGPGSNITDATIRNCLGQWQLQGLDFMSPQNRNTNIIAEGNIVLPRPGGATSSNRSFWAAFGTTPGVTAVLENNTLNCPMCEIFSAASAPAGLLTRCVNNISWYASGTGDYKVQQDIAGANEIVTELDYNCGLNDLGYSANVLSPNPIGVNDVDTDPRFVDPKTLNDYWTQEASASITNVAEFKAEMMLIATDDFDQALAPQVIVDNLRACYAPTNRALLAGDAKQIGAIPLADIDRPGLQIYVAETAQ